MIYRFVIVSDEVEDFRRDIEIDGYATFAELEIAILDSVGYSRDQITTFIICDDHWEQTAEITMVDMGSSTEDDLFLMDDTRLDEFLQEEKQKLMFTFDMLGNRSFFMELREISYDRKLDKPKVVRSKGEAPVQLSDEAKLFAAPIVESSTGSLDNDEYNEFGEYGDIDLEEIEDFTGQGYEVRDDY